MRNCPFQPCGAVTAKDQSWNLVLVMGKPHGRQVQVQLDEDEWYVVYIPLGADCGQSLHDVEHKAIDWSLAEPTFANRMAKTFVRWRSCSWVSKQLYRPTVDWFTSSCTFESGKMLCRYVKVESSKSVEWVPFTYIFHYCLWNSNKSKGERGQA